MTSWMPGPLRAHRVAAACTTLVLALAITAASLILTHSFGQATSSASAYDVPFVDDTNPDPNIVETTITAKEATVDLTNDPAAPAELNSTKAQTFNGTIPGPTFKLKVGDTVIVHYKNELPRESAIHWHGIEVANAMDGTPFTQQQVQPGGTFLYKFKVNRPGIFWYHPHHHSSTNQVFKGLYGLIIVTDPNEAALQANGTLPPASQTLPLVLSDTTVCKATNDTVTYTTGPHVSGSPFPPTAQAPPVPKDLCETTPLNEEGVARGAFSPGEIPNVQRPSPFPAGQGRVNEGQTVLTNGKTVGARTATQGAEAGGSLLSALGAAPAAGAEIRDVQSGQGLRLQMVNTATTRYMRLRLTDATGAKINLIRVGGEGGLLNRAILEGGLQGTFDTGYNTGEILLPAGTRADVVAAIPTGLPLNSVLTLWTEDFKRLSGAYPNLPTVPVMHLKVTGNAAVPYTITGTPITGAPLGTALRTATGSPVELLPSTGLGALLDPNTFLPAPGKVGKDPPGLDTISFTRDMAGDRELGVDDVVGTHDVTGDYSDAAHLGSTRYAKEGDVLALSIKDTTTIHHPFHLHGFAIQPISLTKNGGGGPDFTFDPANPEFRDNVDIPGDYTLNFRIRLEPRPLVDGTTPGGALGRWVFHCHIFFHATFGMLSELVVVPASGNERPDVNVNGTAVTANQGATATIAGTFKDRDGDAVTLTSSVGTVAKTGTNGWTWTFPTGTANSQFVYVTATDAAGLKSQIPFSLTVVNTGGPTVVVPSARTVATGNPLTFGISATDPDPPDTLKLTASGLPAGLSFKDNGNRTGTVSGKATAAPGDYTATFTADDGHGHSATGQVKITITPLAVVLSNPERLVKKAITVGCRFYSVSLRSCTASVYASRKRVGRASGTQRRTGKRTVNVTVPLSSTVRRKIAKSIPGIAVEVRLSAKKFSDSKTYTTSGTTRVVAPTVTARPSFSAFSRNSATVNARAKTYLKSVAKQVGKATRIVCTGHPDGTSAALATRRAKAACAVLKSAGLKAKFASSAARIRSRKIEITIQR